MQPDMYRSDLLRYCVTDSTGNPIALAVVAQSHGAIGIVFSTSETFLNGQIMGFSSNITIPCIVVSGSTMDFLFEHVNSSVQLEFAPISSAEARKVKQLNQGFYAWLYISVVLYSAVLILIIYMIFIDVRAYFLLQQRFPWAFPVKIVCLLPPLFYLLWCAVDPFCMERKMSWPSAFFLCFSQGLVAAAEGLVLLLWVQAVHLSERTNTFLNFRFVVGSIYSLVAIQVVVALVNGIMWYSYAASIAFESITMICLLYFAAGFIIYGRYIIKRTSAGNSKCAGTSSVSIKATIFVIGCTILSLPILIVSLSNGFGWIFSNLFDMTICWLGLLMALLILFFKRPKKLSRVVAEETD